MRRFYLLGVILFVAALPFAYSQMHTSNEEAGEFRGGGDGGGLNESSADLLYWRLDGSNAPPTAAWNMGQQALRNVGVLTVNDSLFEVLNSGGTKIFQANPAGEGTISMSPGEIDIDSDVFLDVGRELHFGDVESGIGIEEMFGNVKLTFPESGSFSIGATRPYDVEEAVRVFEASNTTVDINAMTKIHRGFSVSSAEPQNFSGHSVLFNSGLQIPGGVNFVVGDSSGASYAIRADSATESFCILDIALQTDVLCWRTGGEIWNSNFALSVPKIRFNSANLPDCSDSNSGLIAYNSSGHYGCHESVWHKLY